MWVKVRLRRPGSSDERVVSAYANGGFRAGEPTIILPASLALELGFDVRGERATRGLAIGGLEAEMRELGQAEVKVEVGDRPTPWARCRVLHIEGQDEALLSRELMGALGIRPFYDIGKWRLADDEPGVLRDEAEPEYFPPP